MALGYKVQFQGVDGITRKEGTTDGQDCGLRARVSVVERASSLAQWFWSNSGLQFSKRLRSARELVVRRQQGIFFAGQLGLLAVFAQFVA
jgi:hypothetical protein